MKYSYRLSDSSPQITQITQITQKKINTGGPPVGWSEICYSLTVGD
jgi:hypothetical protein